MHSSHNSHSASPAPLQRMLTWSCVKAEGKRCGSTLSVPTRVEALDFQAKTLSHVASKPFSSPPLSRRSLAAAAAAAGISVASSLSSRPRIGLFPCRDSLIRSVVLQDAATAAAVMLSLSRALGRRIFSSAAAASESAAAASTSAVRKAQNPLEEFFEVERSTEEDKPPPHYGRSWKASELRLKSWDDLQKLWYVLLKEKNMLMTQRQMLHSENMQFPNPERISKVKKSMCRIKHVLTERAIAEPDPRRSSEMKRMINAL